MSQPLRFALLRHLRDPDPHFDLMLEDDGELLTFQLSTPPRPGRQSAVMLEPHRIEYLTHEGEVSGGRGSVTREDAGTYRREIWEEGEMTVHLQGARHAGRLTFVQAPGGDWLMEWAPEGA